jgi:hypothetical protein
LGLSDTLAGRLQSEVYDAGLELVSDREKIKNYLRLSYKCPYDMGMLNRTHLDLAEVQGQSIEKAINDLPTFEGAQALNDRDRKIIQCMWRLIMGVACYLNVKDPDLTLVKDPQRIHLGERPDISLLGKSFKNSPGWHLRRSHFRVLRHERFQRDDEGKPRVLWIRETEVGKDAASNA